MSGVRPGLPPHFVSRPCNAMETVGSGEESTPVKPSKPSDKSQETPITSSYPDWPSPMQAYYGAGSTQPPFFPPPVASPSPYPYMWGGQQLISPYGTPIPYPALYPHGGLYPHPNMVMAQGAAVSTTQTEGKSTPVKKVKSSLNTVKGSQKEACGSGNDGASRSGESGSGASSDASDEDINREEISANKNQSFDQMLAQGATTENNSSHHSSAVFESSSKGNGEPSANHPVPLTSQAGAANLNMGMELWNASPIGPVPLPGRSNASGVPAVAPVTRAGHEGIGSDRLWVQDERELKRQRRKLSNRESARRSRLRKQAECDELQVTVETLNDENDSLRKELERLSAERQKLSNENSSLVGELTQLYGEDAVSTLKDKNNNKKSVLQSSYGECNGLDKDTTKGNN